MGAFVRYLRQNPWQRRLVTLSVAAVLGVAAAWVIYPWVRDRQVLKLLGSDSTFDRQRGIEWALRLAPRRPELVELLERRLDRVPDVQFAAMAEVLNRFGRFTAEVRTGRQMDRQWAINLASAQGRPGTGELRLVLTGNLILCGRDNPHVRGGLAAAATDTDPAVRAASAVLAARLSDDDTLRRLMADAASPAVRARAALDAGLAARSGCIADARKLFAPEGTDPERAAAACALARLDPKGFDAPLGAAIRQAAETGRDDLLAGLLHAATLAGTDRARAAVVDVLDAARRADTPVPAEALWAAGRLKAARAAPLIPDALRKAADAYLERPSPEAAEPLAAAVYAAGRLGAPAKYLPDVMARLWDKDTSMAMILSAEALGRMKDPSREVLDVLTRAAQQMDAPVPAAAAAVALFHLAPGRGTDLLRAACEHGNFLAGDYATWRLGRSARPEAWRVAGEFFGPHVYNRQVRANGAMLLALLSHGTDRAGRAAGLIDARLRARGGEKDPFVAGTYHCALLMLGREKLAGEAAALAEGGAFPRRRALTALVVAGEPAGIDLVLADVRSDLETIDARLTGLLLAPVYAELLERLPRVDVAAPWRVRAWQVRTLRDAYLIHRRSVLDTMRR